MVNTFSGDFEMKVCGIPCQIMIDTFHIVEGDRNTWASDWDYYGYEDIEFTILDRKGYKANWLYNKAKREGEINRIINKIREHKEIEREYDPPY